MKKNKQIAKPLPHLGNPLKGMGGGLRDILIGATTHPVTAALAVMVLCSSVKMISGVYKEDSPNKRKLAGELSGLYDGAQKLAAASAVVPVVVGALNLTAEAVSKMPRGAPPGPPLPPPPI